MNAVLLKRTFTQMDINGEAVRFWRVMSPEHHNYQSDLSIEGLKEWGIICTHALDAR